MNKKLIIIDNFSISDRECVDNVLQETKSTLYDLCINKTVVNRVFSVAVECLDNVLKHSEFVSDDTVTKKFPARYTLIKEGETLVINIRNILLAKNVKELTNRLDKINLLNSEDLKKLYKSTLSKAEISEKGGAGLGLIITAKISRQKIIYEFEKVNEKLYYFVLQIKFNNICE